MSLSILCIATGAARATAGGRLTRMASSSATRSLPRWLPSSRPLSQLMKGFEKIQRWSQHKAEQAKMAALVAMDDKQPQARIFDLINIPINKSKIGISHTLYCSRPGAQPNTATTTAAPMHRAAYSLALSSSNIGGLRRPLASFSTVLIPTVPRVPHATHPKVTRLNGARALSTAAGAAAAPTKTLVATKTSKNVGQTTAVKKVKPAGNHNKPPSPEKKTKKKNTTKKHPVRLRESPEPYNPTNLDIGIDHRAFYQRQCSLFLVGGPFP